MTPSSLKRRSPGDSTDDGIDSPRLKKRRTDSYVPQTPLSGSPGGDAEAADFGDDAEKESPVVVPSENEEMDMTLQRSLALALNHIGFDSASPEALNSMALLLESYTSKFLSNVKVGMTTCRRTVPIPQDYEYALERMQIPVVSLVPHKKLPPGLPSLLPQHLPQGPLSESFSDKTVGLLIPKLSGARDKASKRYIPKIFPTFPAKHTYKFTTYVAAGPETDPSIIRERAAAERRQAEHLAHLRLDQEQRNQGQHIAKQNQSEIRKTRDQLWENLVKGVSSSPGGEVGEGRIKRVVVNAAKKYHRRIVRKKLVEKSTSSVETARN